MNNLCNSYLLKIFFALAFFILIFSNIQSQTLSLYGNVRDKENSLPLESVSVTLDKSHNHSHTDDKGNFYFEKIEPGTHALSLEKTGYEAQVVNFTITNNDTLNVQLGSRSISLNEVAIQADMPVSAASSSYLSQINFLNRPKNSAQDLLRLVPGLFIAQHAGGGKAEQLFVRGFDCDHGTDVATFVDGIPVNMPSHGHGQGYADLHFLIPEVVEGMTIFKGTSSPYYGDFATGAAVNFKTYDSLPASLVQLEAGSVPQVRAITGSRILALLKVPVANNRITSYFAVDDINNRGYFVKTQDFKRLNLFSKITFLINEYSRVQFSVSGFGSSWNASGQIPERAVSQGMIGRYGSIDPHEGGTTQRNNYNLTYNTKLGQGEFETQAYSFTYRFKLFSNFTFFLDDTVKGDMIEQDDNRTVKGLNTKYSIGHPLFGLNNTFTMGASFRADEIENQLWHAPERIRSVARAYALIHQRSNSIYLNEIFRFNQHFRLEAGLRYDYFIFDVEDLLPTDSIHKNYSGFNYQSAINPKLNLIYSVNPKLQFFLNGGSGFHSNDARAVVQDKIHRLPLAVSAEVGALFHIKKAVISAALWGMDLNNELVYVGDDGTTEDKGASRRVGIDISCRVQLFSWLFADADINVARCRLTDTLFGPVRKTNFYLPLAPSLTSVGGLTVKLKNGFESSIRYRYMESRPANESASVMAHGYSVIDYSADYRFKRCKIGLIIENLFNVNWNEAQFDTETRLRSETQPVEELHYTPGTPFYAKLILSYSF